MIASVLVTASLLLAGSNGRSRESYFDQMRTIISFYEALGSERPPRVSDFVRLFGAESEEELELILRDEFPQVKGSAVLSNKSAHTRVREIFAKPESFQSRFLLCVKALEGKLFVADGKRQIEWPPDEKGDFRRYRVVSAAGTAIFEFSQDEPLIESIYLPNGRALGSRLSECPALQQQ